MARLLPPESAAIDVVAREIGIGADTQRLLHVDELALPPILDGHLARDLAHPIAGIEDCLSCRVDHRQLRPVNRQPQPPVALQRMHQSRLAQPRGIRARLQSRKAGRVQEGTK